MLTAAQRLRLSSYIAETELAKEFLGLRVSPPTIIVEPAEEADVLPLLSELLGPPDRPPVPVGANYAAIYLWPAVSLVVADISARAVAA
jgi:hypothetical protein